MPLRKLVPNRARSFDVCLEKRRLVSGAGALGGAMGPEACDGGAGEGRGREGNLGSV